MAGSTLQLALGLIFAAVGFQLVIWPEGCWQLGFLTGAPSTDAHFIFLLRALGIMHITAGVWFHNPSLLPADCSMMTRNVLVIALSYWQFKAVATNTIVIAFIGTLLFYLSHYKKGGKNATAVQDIATALWKFFYGAMSIYMFAAAFCPQCTILKGDGAGFFATPVPAATIADPNFVLTVKVLAAFVGGVSCSFTVNNADNIGVGLLATNVVLAIFAVQAKTTPITDPAGLVSIALALLLLAINVVDLYKKNGARLIDCDALQPVNDLFDSVFAATTAARAAPVRAPSNASAQSEEAPKRKASSKRK